MRAAILMSIFLVLGCSKEKVAPKYPERLPVHEQATELMQLPKYNVPAHEGKITAVEAGEEAPHAGVILDDTSSLAAARLRIDYDQLYRDADANRKFALTVIKVQEQELYRADRTIEQKNVELREIRDSWWQNNKAMVGLGVGVLTGIIVSVVTGYVWAEIEKEQGDGQ